MTDQQDTIEDPDAEWERVQAGEVIQAAMTACLMEDPQEQMQMVIDALQRYLDLVRERYGATSMALVRLAILLAVMGVATLRDDEDDAQKGEEDEGGESIIEMVDSATGLTISDPDAEATTPEAAAALAAARILAAMSDNDVNRALAVLDSLPDRRSAMMTLLMLATTAGRASLDLVERQGGLDEEGVRRLAQIRAEEEAGATAPPDVHVSPEGMSIRLPPVSLDQTDPQTRAHIKEQSRGPGIYALSVVDPDDDIQVVAKAAIAHMVSTRPDLEYLCEHSHHAAITLDEVIPSMRQYVDREIRRRTKMHSRPSVILLVWRHLVDCGGQDVIPGPAMDF